MTPWRATKPAIVTAPPPPVSVEQVYVAHARRLVLQLHAYAGDLTTAQDLVQEAFCRALPQWHRISRYDDPVAWIRRVAWNLASSRWRRVRRARALAAREHARPVPGPDPNRVAVIAALARLPATHRRVLVLHYIGDLGTAEIARREGVADSTVRAWLHRGRRKLAALLSDTEDRAAMVGAVSS